MLEVINRIEEGREPDAEPGPAAGGQSETFTLADDLRLQVVDHLLKEDFRVPPMPQLTVRVFELTRKEDFSLRELGNLILTDQAVAAQVLRQANSALRGFERPVDTLPMAVQRLGSDEVIRIVLAASLQARRPGRDLFAAEKHHLWAHSSAAAFFARTLASRVGLDHNLGFLCGLLMDFGQNVLYSLIQDILGRKVGPGHIPEQVVAGIIQDYHPRVGRVVGEKWRLPQAVVEAMAHHHNVEGATSDVPYVAIAALADFLATFALSQPRAALEESLADFPPERLTSHPAARLVNLSPRGVADVLRVLPRQLDQALEMVVQ